VNNGKKTIEKSKRRKIHRRFFVRLHPLFWAMGIVYAFTGDLLLFVISCLVALQHECAHAFAAAKRGYVLNAVVLMPYGAVIDGDLEGLTFQDEIAVAAAGPLCNLLTAALFGALWWFFPETYAFTDTAFYASLTVALVNLLPVYPLDGGRILRGALFHSLLKKRFEPRVATRRAKSVCKTCGFVFAGVCLAAFIGTVFVGTVNFSLLAFGLFLAFGAVGGHRDAVYERMDFSCSDMLKKGLPLRRVAVWEGSLIKDALSYIVRGEYLVLEVYDENETHLFNLPQNELSKWFLRAESPYDTLGEIYEKERKTPIF
jgi:stage IV sporulation protein FB